MATDLSSITAGANYLAAQPTPAANLSNFLSNQQNMLANQQTQRTQQSQIAINNAVKANIDPTTGQPNVAATAMAISQDPNITVGGQDAINSLYDGKNKALQMNGAQLDQAIKTTNVYADELQGAVANAAKENRPVNQNDIASVGANLINAKVMTPQQATQQISNMPTDPQGMHNWVVQHSIDTQNQVESLQRISGALTSVQAGATNYQGNADLNTGAFTPQTSLTNTASPTDMNALVSWNDPVTNQPKTGTYAQRLAAMNVNPQSVAQPNGAPPGLTSGGSSDLPPGLRGPNAGSYTGPTAVNPTGTPAPTGNAPGSPAAGMNLDANPPGAPAPATPASPYGNSIASGPAPIPFGLAGKAAASSSDQFLADQKDAASYQQRANAGTHVLDLLDALPANATGPGTAGFTAIKSGMNAWTGSIPGVGFKLFNSADITNTELLHKNLVQLASSMPGAGQSIDALASAFAGNPNINMQTSTIRDATASILALQKMKQTFLTEYQQQYPNDQGGGGYQKWLSTKASAVDPRAWAVDTMTPAAKTVLFKSLQSNPTAMAKFQSSLAQADASGTLNNPGGGQ